MLQAAFDGLHHFYSTIRQGWWGLSSGPRPSWPPVPLAPLAPAPASIPKYMFATWGPSVSNLVGFFGNRDTKMRMAQSCSAHWDGSENLSFDLEMSI